MIRRQSRANWRMKRIHFAVVALIALFYWFGLSYVVDALECVSMGGEISFGVSVDCSMDFSEENG